MYRTCIFCSAGLGSNDSIEEFPVGRSVAFDAWKGRLWAVCPRCSRWNLAPIEERWEATEAAERLFRDSRLRAHSENVGLAKLPDGTRLIRIGQALPGELAAWRYGEQLVGRFRTTVPLLLVGIAAIPAAQWLLVLAAGTALLPVGLPASATIALGAAVEVSRYRRAGRVALRVDAPNSPTGSVVRVLRRHLHGVRVVPGGGGIAVEVYGALAGTRWSGEPLRLEGAAARSLLGRTMVGANRGGGTRRMVSQALAFLTEAGSAEGYLRSVAERRLRVYSPATTAQLFSRVGHLGRPVGTFPQEALALEMALHEETERRALEGELAALEAAWREAEEIAAIADALPDDPLDRLRQG